MMKSRKRATVDLARWASYAVAGAATAMSANNDAEGAILYSGVLNQPVNPAAGIHYGYIKSLIANSHQGALNLGYLTHQYIQFPPNPGGGPAQAEFYGKVAFNNTHLGVHGQWRGTHVGTHNYASKLALGANISGGPFNGPAAGGYSFGSLAEFNGTVAGGHPPGPGSVVGNRQWTTDGAGFLGFKFNTGAGVEYGWARITMSGGYKHEMELVDYAYGTPGQAIAAGQTATPEPASLGMLALGAAGLLATRLGRRPKIA